MPKIDKTKTLYVRWSKKEQDLLYNYPRKSDAGALIDYFERLENSATCDGKLRTMRKELEARGYDITTLKFSIKRK